MTQTVFVNVIIILTDKCVKCQCEGSDHRDNICYGRIDCTCMKFESPIMIAPLNNQTGNSEQCIIYSRTDTPLPQFISTHDNWRGNGWEYQKKWGKTQGEMVEILVHRCGLTVDETRRFLRCKHTSVRGRLSEVNRDRITRIGL